ncbi:MAG: MFS transporter, partial [Bradyrhizobium sp.]
SWRTPLVIIVCGCAIALLGFGPRSALGFFIQPMGHEFSWGRDVFGLAFAVQNLLWGLGQPLAGAIADRFGIFRVMFVGAVLYAGGLLMMRYAATPLSLNLGAGVLIGFGLSGCSFNLVLSAFSKLLPPERRGIALGAGTAAGSFGQFVFAPFGVALIDNVGWQAALTVFAALMLLIVPLSLALSTPPARAANVPAAQQQSFRTALAEAFGHRSYVLLVLGFFTCGFQLAFVTVHLPAFLVDRGISAQTGGWVMASIGLFNMIGSLSVGWLQNRLPKRYILSAIYFTRALATVAFISFPITPVSAIAFGAVSGLLWLSTVPPTSALVSLMFGTRWFATLYGFAFVSHQVGGFLGVWLGGIVFEKFGSYTPIWWLSILFGVLSALINLPIVEKPIERTVAQPA